MAASIPEKQLELVEKVYELMGMYGIEFLIKALQIGLNSDEVRKLIYKLEYYQMSDSSPWNNPGHEEVLNKLEKHIDAVYGKPSKKRKKG